MSAIHENPVADVTVEAEQAILGALLTDSRAIDRVEFLRDEQFFLQTHRRIFAAIRRISARGDVPDVMLVWTALKDASHAENDSLAYLNQIAGSSPGGANAKRYARMVADRWTLRNIASVALDLADKARNPKGTEPAAIVETAITALEALLPKAPKSRQFLSGWLTDIVDRIDAEYQGNAERTKLVSTGLRDLDAKLDGGMRPGEVIIVAGRPSMGKTAAALGIADAASTTDAPALVFSQEMPGEQLALRALSRASGIPIPKLKDGSKMVDADFALLTTGLADLNDDRILIDDRPELSIAQIRSSARDVKREHGKLGVIVVDYLQLMAETEGSNRTQSVGANSRGLKALAKELDVPVVVLAQLNRKLEERADRRPIMSDLRDSGEIEQDADIVVLLYRDEVYNPDSADKGIVELNVAKQRNGSTGVVPAIFVGERTAFLDAHAGVQFGAVREKKAVGFGSRRASKLYTEID
ncbi:replicative DNA helicase [Paraburkholderia solisilvae]|uniref:Replicative DNA helicase n=1 Tax=Paraburkholderia solisilvae TaxID=624376 RepID=A0A6J5EYH5_9BURK|nr:replicative DNA helicase [Paraburkholderia solisilvae]CAB3770517.1 Replicative DNA helicase [Paraburkholderia solisilvae]